MAPAALRRGADAYTVFAGGQRDLMGADGLAFGCEFYGGVGGFGRIDGEIHGEMLAGEDCAGDADRLRLELGLGASGERNGVDGDAGLLGLPCGARGRAVILVAVGDEQRRGGSCRRAAKPGLRGRAIRYWCRVRRRLACAANEGRIRRA